MSLLLRARRHRQIVAAGAPPLPLLVAGSKAGALGDSILALPHVFTTSSVRTTADNRAIGELVVARGISPRFKFYNWWDSTATSVLRGGTYTDVSGGNADIYRSGAVSAYAGDTVGGIAKRRAQVIGSTAQWVLIAAGTNTDTNPNDTAAEKIVKLTAEIAGYRAAGIRVVIATVRPRSSGGRETLTNVLSTTSGSGVVTLVRAGHGLTNTSAATREVEFISPGVTISGITLNGRISSGSGGWTVNVVDANTITFSSATLANATVSNGGGAFTWHRNFFTSAAGASAVGLCIMPSSTRWTEYDALNTWVRAQDNPANGVYVWDNVASYRDPALSAVTGVTLEIDKSLTSDGVHPNHKGAFVAGTSLNATLDRFLSPGYWYTRDVSTGNLLANPTMAGTTGGTIGASCSGALPPNCVIQNVSGAGRPVTTVCSVEANAETGGNTLVLDITSDGTGAANAFDVVRLSWTNPATGFTSTDWVYAVIDFQSVASPIHGGIQATIGQASAISNYGWRSSGAVANNDPGAVRFYDHNVEVMTEPLLVEARTSLNPRLDISIRGDVAGTTRVKVPYRKLFVGPNPTVDYPWVP